MRNIIDKHKDIENKIKILENTLEDFNDVEFRNKMIVEIKKKHEENVIIREEEQEPLKKFLERHTKLLEAKKEDPVIYFIAEYERVFTSEENSYNLLYIGETTRWSHRQKSYNDLDSNSIVSSRYRRTRRAKLIMERRVADHQRRRRPPLRPPAAPYH